MAEVAGTREHEYVAEAVALSGYLKSPIMQEIKPLAFVKLPESGGYQSERLKDYHLEGVLSFRSAYTQVAGNRDPKPGHGWTTLATAVIEDFNLLDVVTADRIVAQAAADYPLEGYVPTITLLGTRFDNLRIAGHPVHHELNTDLFELKPPDDASSNRDLGFRERFSRQLDKFRDMLDLPASIAERYNRSPSSSSPQESIECSLVNHTEGSWPGRSYGHVIDIPHFGRVFLATVRWEHSEYQTETGMHPKTQIRLTMLEAEMGCIASGKVSAGALILNGKTKP